MVESKVILLVDDDPRIRELCSNILGGNGYDVLDADNAMEALIIAADRKGGIGLLLTQWDLSGTSGVTLARAFEKLWPNVGHLYISPSRALGGNAPVVYKPIHAESLLHGVRQSLDEPIPV